MLPLTYPIKNSHTLEDIWEKTLPWLEVGRWFAPNRGWFLIEISSHTQNIKIQPGLPSAQLILWPLQRLRAKKNAFPPLLSVCSSLLFPCILGLVADVSDFIGCIERIHADSSSPLVCYGVWAPKKRKKVVSFLLMTRVCCQGQIDTLGRLGVR